MIVIRRINVLLYMISHMYDIEYNMFCNSPQLSTTLFIIRRALDKPQLLSYILSYLTIHSIETHIQNLIQENENIYRKNHYLYELLASLLFVNVFPVILFTRLLECLLIVYNPFIRNWNWNKLRRQFFEYNVHKQNIFT